jgi:hypothetical protein
LVLCFLAANARVSRALNFELAIKQKLVTFLSIAAVQNLKEKFVANQKV